MTWWDAWSVVILAATVTTALVTMIGFPGPIRPAVTLFFALTCPGMSLVRLLRLDDPLAELTLGIASSVAIAGLVGGVLLYYGAWAPEGGLAILILVALAGLVGDRVPARLGIRPFLAQRSPARSLGLTRPSRGPLSPPHVRTLQPPADGARAAAGRSRSPAPPERTSPGSRTPGTSDPFTPTAGRETVKKTAAKALDELAERRDEPQL